MMLPAVVALLVASAEGAVPNSRPVIGLMTQPTDVDPSYNLSKYGKSYLVASYVKWVEAAVRPPVNSR